MDAATAVAEGNTQYFKRLYEEAASDRQILQEQLAAANRSIAVMAKELRRANSCCEEFTRAVDGGGIRYLEERGEWDIGTMMDIRFCPFCGDEK